MYLIDILLLLLYYTIANTLPNQRSHNELPLAWIMRQITCTGIACAHRNWHEIGHSFMMAASQLWCIPSTNWKYEIITFLYSCHHWITKTSQEGIHRRAFFIHLYLNKFCASILEGPRTLQRFSQRFFWKDLCKNRCPYIKLLKKLLQLWKNVVVCMDDN